MSNAESAEIIEVLDPEVVGAELAKVESQAGLAEDSALALRGQFGDFYNDIVALRDTATNVTELDNPVHQKVAREVRLGLKRVRCEVERVRKTLKADSLARGKAIDGFANVLKYLCEPVEKKLEAVEQYAARQEAARIAALAQERAAALVEFNVDPTAYNLGIMDDDTFRLVLEAGRKRHADAIEAARAEEAARIERENADRLARERAEADAKAARVEAEKARKAQAAAEAKAKKEREDAEAKAREIEAKAQAEREAATKQAQAERAAADAKAAAERAKAEAALRVEREARERAQAEAAESARKEAARVKAEQDAIAARAKAEREAAERAARAPDRDKLLRYADVLCGVPIPAMATEQGQTVAAVVKGSVAALVMKIRGAAEGM